MNHIPDHTRAYTWDNVVRARAQHLITVIGHIVTALGPNRFGGMKSNLLEIRKQYFNSTMGWMYTVKKKTNNKLNLNRILLGGLSSNDVEKCRVFFLSTAGTLQCYSLGVHSFLIKHIDRVYLYYTYIYHSHYNVLRFKKYI